MDSDRALKRDVWTFLAVLLALSSIFYAIAMLVPESRGAWLAATQETSGTAWLTTEYGASFAIAGVVLALVFWRAGPGGGAGAPRLSR